MYRGIWHASIDLDDYKIGGINFWPGFSSTSKDKNFARDRSRGDKDENPALIFEIFVAANSNNPSCNIDLPRNWSFYPSEKEVLIMPFFCFTVLAIEEDENDNTTTIIKVAEIPH